MERGDFENAGKDIRDYLSNHADSADAHFLLGYILYRQNKPTDSLAEFTQGAHFRKPGAKDLAVVAMDYILLRDYADADKWLTEAAAWEPANALYWYYLGRTKYNENRFQEAIEAFHKSLKLQPNDIRAEYNLGLSYAGLGQEDEAISAYRTAIDWQKDSAQKSPQPYLDLGVLLAKQGHIDQATLYLEQAVALDPHNPKPHEELGRAYEQLHKLANAESELKTAVSLAPQISPLHFELGRIYQQEGKSPQAREEFARCSQLNAAHSTDSNETPNLARPNKAP